MDTPANQSQQTPATPPMPAAPAAVEQPQTPQAMPPMQAEVKKSMSPMLMGLVAIVILLLVAAGSYFYFFVYQPRQEAMMKEEEAMMMEAEPSPTAAPTEQPLSSGDELNDIQSDLNNTVISDDSSLYSNIDGDLQGL